MGLIYRHVPEQHALRLATLHELKVFVETGTLLGKSAAWASSHFQRVITIEGDEDYYNKAQAKNVGLPIEFILGLSKDVLPDIVQSLGRPALFFLDAHWSRDLTYGKPEVVCPVLDELRIINKGGLDHVIIVDDARLFGGLGWPSMSSVVSLLRKDGERKVTMKDDVFIAEPIKGDD